MKYTKKFLSILLTFLLIAIGTTNMNVYAENISTSEAKNTNDIILSEEDVFEALAYTFGDQVLKKSIKAKKVLSPSGALIDSFDSESYSNYTNNEYGGMYLNDDGVLVLCYVADSNTLKSSQKISKIKSSKLGQTLINPENEAICNYTFKEVQYSEKELLEAYDTINELAIKNNNIIKTVNVDILRNRIIIGLTDASDISLINNEISIDNGIYAFEILDKDFEINDIATISGTSAINNGKISSTPAGKIYSSVLKKYGVVTCGHGWSVGDAVYSGSTKIGSIKYRYYNGTNDSSFILLNNGHNYSDSHYDEFDISVPVVGSSITLRGYRSGKISGVKVTHTNSTIVTSGVTFTGLIECNKQVQPGDSGGGAIGKIIDGGRTATIIGINKAAGNGYTYLVKGKVIYNAYEK